MATSQGKGYGTQSSIADYSRSLPRTSEQQHNQLAELVTSFIYSECNSPKGTSIRGQ